MTVQEPEQHGPSCCPASAPRLKTSRRLFEADQAPQTPVGTKVHIPGGQALLGTKHPVLSIDGEGPQRRKKISAFHIGETTVTNAEFEHFVEQTGYVTDAEHIGWSFVFWSHIDARIKDSQAVQDAEWWRRIDGANWRDINGPGSQETVWFPDHPVIHVSWNDALAFAKWVGGRLPREIEWEHAARGGAGDVRFPWGDQEPDDAQFFPCNIWQGTFPETNSCNDGYASTAPAKSFQANGYGLYNMVGNVWEWCADPFVIRSLSKAAAAHRAQMQGRKLIKGGSFLCHRSYCYRYRIAARTGNTPDTSTSHTGFRVAWD